jgi:hypothetical protein
MTTKETVRAILDRLPDNCSIDDVLYQLYVVRAVHRGDADAAGRTVLRSRPPARSISPPNAVASFPN